MPPTLPKTAPLVTLLLALCVAGCAAKPRTYHAPDSAAVVESGRRLGDAVAGAVETSGKARLYFAVAKKGTDDVSARLAAVAPKLGILFQNAPPELKPLVEEIQAAIAKTRAELDVTIKAVDETQAWQKQLLTQLEEAIKARDAHAVEQAAFIGRSEKLAAAATAENGARVKAEGELRAMQQRSLLHKILTGAGILGAVAVAFLFFTGKLAGALAFR